MTLIFVQCFNRFISEKHISKTSLSRLAVSELEIWNILAQPSPQQSYKIYAGHRAFNTNFSVYISNSVLVMVVGAVQAMQTLKYFQASSLCSRF